MIEHCREWGMTQTRGTRRRGGTTSHRQLVRVKGCAQLWAHHGLVGGGGSGRALWRTAPSSYWRDKVEDFCVHFVKWQRRPIMIQVLLVGDGPHSGKLADVDEHDDVEMLTLAWNCRCWGFRWKPGNHKTTGCQKLKILLFFFLPFSSCTPLLRPYGTLSACVCVYVCVRNGVYCGRSSLFAKMPLVCSWHQPPAAEKQKKKKQ